MSQLKQEVVEKLKEYGLVLEEDVQLGWDRREFFPDHQRIALKQGENTVCSIERRGDFKGDEVDEYGISQLKRLMAIRELKGYREAAREVRSLSERLLELRKKHSLLKRDKIRDEKRELEEACHKASRFHVYRDRSEGGSHYDAEVLLFEQLEDKLSGLIKELEELKQKEMREKIVAELKSMGDIE